MEYLVQKNYEMARQELEETIEYLELSEMLPNKELVNQAREMTKTYKNSREQINSSLEYNSADEEIRSLRLALAKFIYPELSMIDKSFSIINDLIDEDPFLLDALEARAFMYLWRLKDFDKAEENALKILDIEPRDSDGLRILAYVYLLRDGDQKKSCRYWSRAIEEKGGSGYYKDLPVLKRCQTLGLIKKN